jgi:glucose-1-phosphate thymidylyltransferase
MQVIIPLAGKGTRLRPHTHLVPKPLLKVAGRPVMDWVMDTLAGLDVTELIFITGHLKEQVEEYARARYPIPSRFIEQKVQDGHGRRRQPRPAVRPRADPHRLRGHGVRG